MIQRLLMLTASLVLICEGAYGLGLGKLDLQSALNQEFRAEIELTSVGGLGESEILPNLASQDDFDRVGVERNYLLTNLRFSVYDNAEGDKVVLVTSSRPIVEPYLNFLVEVIWPNGRILREYTVLLDPPAFGEGGVQALNTAAAAAKPAAAPVATPKPAARPATQVTTTTRAPASLAEGEIIGDEYGVTGPGDTLWKIAARVRPDRSVTIQQTMLALQRANPEAFINDNINLLKAGHVLRIPDSDEIRAERQADAVAEVQQHNDEFDDYRAGNLTQLDARSRRNTRDDADASAGSGELKIVAANRGSGQRSGAAETESGNIANEALENELALARENLDRNRRETTEMNVRLDDLQEQIETLNEIVQLKDDQLAALRAELQKSMDAPAAPAPDPQPAPSDSLLSNPFVLGGLGLLVVAALAGFFFYRSRSASGAVADDEPQFDDLPVVDDSSDDVGLNETIEIEEEVVGADDEEALEPQTSDLISEAEIYIAYGRFPQAITFLQNAIEAEPNRTDLQLKLLEVYVQTEDATAFNLQYEQMQLLGDEDANARAAELQKQIPGAAESASASMDATVISAEPVVPISADEDDDLSFDLDDLDAESDDDELSLDDSDELSLDLEDDEAATVILDTPIEESGADSDLDLGEELDLDLDLEADDADGDDLSLDLEDDGDELSLDLEDDDDELSLDLEGDGDELTLDLEDDSDELSLDLEDSGDELALDLEDDGEELSLDLEDADDDLSLDLDDDGQALSLDGDDELELDLDDDLDLDLADVSLDEDSAEEDLELSLDDANDLSLDDDLELDLDGDATDTEELDLGDDDLDSLSLELDDDAPDLGDDDTFELDLEADENIDLDTLDLDDDLDLGDDDLELDLGDDAGSKLDLARAYIDMGDNDGARELLQEVMTEGGDEDVQAATDLMGKLD